MQVTVQRLTSGDRADFGELWQAATSARRQGLGLDDLPAGEGSVLDRPGAFGVGVFDGRALVSAAVAMPARADDGRGEGSVAGLAHVSSVATAPQRWGQGLGRLVLRGIELQAMRRGFARAQLWTHASNPAARHLYESHGYGLSGRAKLDEFGEEIVHYTRELTAPMHPPRPVARVVCLDPDGRVLLLRWRDPSDGHLLWEPPGGGLEPGETVTDCAMRKWAEETGLPVPHLADARTTVARDLLFNGYRYVADEHFLLARAQSAGCPAPSAQTGVEAACYLGHDWVPWSALGGLADPVEPDLLPVLRRLDPHGPWEGPGAAA
jgi:8-oxo-dGTP pyrophosphatase MutT (NUDIX family)/GNAT superfamily N-acetyltransferase